MPYNALFTKTDSATARCLAGSGPDTQATVTATSIIAQRDADRKAVNWAQGLANSRLRCSFSRFNGVLSVSGSGSFTGVEGGGFAPASAALVLSNTGNDALSWSLDEGSAWVQSNFTFGSLYAGESATLTISLTAAANSLPAGDYTSLVTITNDTTGQSVTVPIYLEVVPVPQLAEAFESFTQSATLCGYSEYTSPSTPPKKYKVQTQSGTVYKGVFSTGDCTEGDFVSSLGSESRTPDVNTTPVLFGYSLAYNSGTDTWTLTLQRSGGYDSTWYGGNYVWGMEWSAGFSNDGITYGGISWGSITGDVAAGSGTHILVATVTGAGSPNFFQLAFNGRHAGTGASLVFYSNPWTVYVGAGAELLRDEWDVVSTYDPDTACSLSELDSSARYTGYGTFPLSVGGTASGAPDENDYSAWLSTSLDTATLTTVTASGSCEVDGSGTAKATGGYTLVLSSEDTPEDALARATPVPGVSGVAAYEPRGAGVFAFDYSEVTKITLNFTDLKVGKNYAATVDLTTEDYGGGSPVVTQRSYNFTASATTHQIVDNTAVTAAYGKQVTVSNPQVEYVP